jgi:membrane-associated phospholipid phosphatase
MDRDVVVWLAEHRVAVLDAVATVLAVAGTGGIVWIVIALVAFRAPRRVLAQMVVPVAATVWAADVIALGLRHLIGRPRPYQAIPGVDAAVGVGGTGPSLPSGHSASSATGAVLLGFLLPRAIPALATLAVAIAASRVHAGFHYPTDVLAGLALGAVIGLTAILALRRFRLRGAPW